MDERRLAVFGQSGSGKSTLLQLLASATPPNRTGLILDLKRDPLEDGGLYPTSRSWLRRPPGDALPSADGPWFDFVDQWARHVFERGETFVILDEASLCIRRGQPPPELVRLLILGRSKRIGWAIATQRPVSVPPSVWAQANELCVFALRHPRDVEVARDLGLTADEARRLPTLKWGQFFHVGAGRTHLHHGFTSACPVEE